MANNCCPETAKYLELSGLLLGIYVGYTVFIPKDVPVTAETGTVTNVPAQSSSQFSEDISRLAKLTPYDVLYNGFYYGTITYTGIYVIITLKNGAVYAISRFALGVLGLFYRGGGRLARAVRRKLGWGGGGGDGGPPPPGNDGNDQPRRRRRRDDDDEELELSRNQRLNPISSGDRSRRAIQFAHPSGRFAGIVFSEAEPESVLQNYEGNMRLSNTGLQSGRLRAEEIVNRGNPVDYESEVEQKVGEFATPQLFSDFLDTEIGDLRTRAQTLEDNTEEYEQVIEQLMQKQKERANKIQASSPQTRESIAELSLQLQKDEKLYKTIASVISKTVQVIDKKQRAVNREQVYGERREIEETATEIANNLIPEIVPQQMHVQVIPFLPILSAESEISIENFPQNTRQNFVTQFNLLREGINNEVRRGEGLAADQAETPAETISGNLIIAIETMRSLYITMDNINNFCRRRGVTILEMITTADNPNNPYPNERLTSARIIIDTDTYQYFIKLLRFLAKMLLSLQNYVNRNYTAENLTETAKRALAEYNYADPKKKILSAKERYDYLRKKNMGINYATREDSYVTLITPQELIELTLPQDERNELQNNFAIILGQFDSSFNFAQKFIKKSLGVFISFFDLFPYIREQWQD